MGDHVNGNGHGTADATTADGQPLERLEAEICHLAGQLAAAACRWLLMVGEFDRRGGWAGWGVVSCAHWLSWKCGLAPNSAREHVRVARALESLPVLTAAFAAGRLSYSKVRAVTRIATPETEEDLVTIALTSPAGQLEAIVRAYRKVLSLAQVNERHERRYLRYHYDDDGSLVGSFRIAPEDSAVLLATLETARTAVRDVSAETPAPSREQANADALVTMAQAAHASLSADPVSESETRPMEPAEPAEPGQETDPEQATPREQETQPRPEQPRAAVHVPIQVMLHVDPATLAAADDGPDTGRGEFDDGPGLHPQTLRRLSCDAAVVRIVEGADGTILDLGRRTRVPSPALRRALHCRDRGGCRFPGCTARRFVQGHHIQHWAHGGETTLANMVLLCSAHHRLLHEGGYTIVADESDAIRFCRPDGTPIPDSPTPPTLTGRIGEHPTSAQIDADTIKPEWYGDRLDMDYVMAVLFSHPNHRAVFDAR